MRDRRKPASIHLPPQPPAFTPVPVRPRRDGWSAARQRGFVAALFAGATIAVATARVGKSATSAYQLRARPGAASFAAAWDAALAHARAQRLPAPPVGPARAGEEFMTYRPVFHGGRQIGCRPIPRDSMLLRALGRRLGSSLSERDVP